ncbi:MAG: hypothetical protein ABIH23_30570, partial [bacterium]
FLEELFFPGGNEYGYLGRFCAIYGYLGQTGSMKPIRDIFPLKSHPSVMMLFFLTLLSTLNSFPALKPRHNDNNGLT